MCNYILKVRLMNYKKIFLAMIVVLIILLAVAIVYPSYSRDKSLPFFKVCNEDNGVHNIIVEISTLSNTEIYKKEHLLNGSSDLYIDKDWHTFMNVITNDMFNVEVTVDSNLPVSQDLFYPSSGYIIIIINIINSKVEMSVAHVNYIN